MRFSYLMCNWNKLFSLSFLKRYFVCTSGRLADGRHIYCPPNIYRKWNNLLKARRSSINFSCCLQAISICLLTFAAVHAIDLSVSSGPIIIHERVAHVLRSLLMSKREYCTEDFRARCSSWDSRRYVFPRH